MNTLSPNKNKATVSAPAFLNFARPVTPFPPPKPSVYYDELQKSIAETTKKEAAREVRFREAIRSLPAELADMVLETWERINNNTPGILKVPLLTEREEGDALLTWNRSAHHLDVEINEDGNLDFFYLNRETNAAWDEEVAPSIPLPTKVLAHFNYFRVVE